MLTLVDFIERVLRKTFYSSDLIFFYGIKHTRYCASEGIGV